MDTLEQQIPINQTILRELISITPEHWSNVMYVTMCEWDSDRIVRITHEISSPDGHNDIIEPSTELLHAIQTLAQIFQSAGLRWKKMSALAHSDSEQKWRLEIEHEYLDPDAPAKDAGPKLPQ